MPQRGRRYGANAKYTSGASECEGKSPNALDELQDGKQSEVICWA